MHMDDEHDEHHGLDEASLKEHEEVTKVKARQGEGAGRGGGEGGGGYWYMTFIAMAAIFNAVISSINSMPL